jgi:hypothetical protein
VINLALPDELLSSNSANADIDVDPYEHVLRVLLQPHIHGGAISQDQSGSKKRFELWT